MLKVKYTYFFSGKLKKKLVTKNSHKKRKQIKLNQQSTLPHHKFYQSLNCQILAARQCCHFFKRVGVLAYWVSSETHKLWIQIFLIPSLTKRILKIPIVLVLIVQPDKCLKSDNLPPMTKIDMPLSCQVSICSSLSHGRAYQSEKQPKFHFIGVLATGRPRKNSEKSQIPGCCSPLDAWRDLL